MKKYSVAFLTSHPVRYQIPLFRNITAHSDVDLMVYYCSNFGASTNGGDFDPQFNRKIDWGEDVYDGYQYAILPNFASKKSPEFWGQVNPGIISILFREKFDAIIIHGWNGVTNWLAFFAAVVTRTPIFLRGESGLHQKREVGLMKSIMKMTILKPLFSKCSAFLVIGEENKRFYKMYGAKEEKCYFAPYTVDNDNFFRIALRATEVRKKVCAQLDIPIDSIVIIVVGKLIKKKSPLDVIRAFSQMKCKEAHLVFIGDGILRQSLEIFARSLSLERVHFVGFKNHSEISDYYCLANVFVLASLREPWGLVVNEAMCFGLPVIVSDCVGSAADLVQEFRNGYIFQHGNSQQLAAYLDELCVNGSKREAFGKQSEEIIRAYNYDVAVRGIIEAIQQRSRQKATP
ncbi:MAG: glycosyltransferase family 4 protein [bacterium]|nr:glycosyltransferase family 4 protein [bacterium]